LPPFAIVAPPSTTGIPFENIKQFLPVESYTTPVQYFSAPADTPLLSASTKVSSKEPTTGLLNVPSVPTVYLHVGSLAHASKHLSAVVQFPEVVQCVVLVKSPVVLFFKLLVFAPLPVALV